MSNWSARGAVRQATLALTTITTLLATLLVSGLALASEGTGHKGGGEANLVLPDLDKVQMLGISGKQLLLAGLGVSALGLVFAFITLKQVEKLPVHKSMAEISDLIWETCKTYLITQGKFILILEIFIGAIIVVYFGVLQQFPVERVAIILFFSLVGIAGSYGVAWYGIRINTYANSRTAFASLSGKPFPLYAIPLKACLLYTSPSPRD